MSDQFDPTSDRGNQEGVQAAFFSYAFSIMGHLAKCRWVRARRTRGCHFYIQNSWRGRRRRPG